MQSAFAQRLALSKYSLRSVIVNTDEEITFGRQMTCCRPHNQEAPVPGIELGSRGTKVQACPAIWIVMFRAYVLTALRVSTPGSFHFRMVPGSFLPSSFQTTTPNYWDWVYATDPKTVISCFQWFRNNGDPVCAGVGLRIWLLQRPHQVGWWSIWSATPGVLDIMRTVNEINLSLQSSYWNSISYRTTRSLAGKGWTESTALGM